MYLCLLSSTIAFSTRPRHDGDRGYKLAQSARDKKLESRSARLKLPVGHRFSAPIGEGLSLIYRRTKDGYGTWSVKLALQSGQYALRKVGSADDYEDANGADVLTFWEAQERARNLSRETKLNSGILIRPTTVAEAANLYLEWFRLHRLSVTATEQTIRAHITPDLGAILLGDLTSANIRDWLEAIAARPARVRTSRLSASPKYRPLPTTSDQKRARRATANRILNVLRAILNRSFEQGMVASDSAWRKVKPFFKADEARIRFLTDLEATSLLQACPSDFRQLVHAALLTGTRYGELTSLLVRDIDLQGRRIYIAHSKSGRPRHVWINEEGARLLRQVISDKSQDAPVFTKATGEKWGKNHQVRPLNEACKKAKIQPTVSFHELRHTYASHLAQAGVDLLSISKLLGHADTRITSKHYAHLADRTLAVAVAKLPAFSRDPGEAVKEAA